MGSRIRVGPVLASLGFSGLLLIPVAVMVGAPIWIAPQLALTGSHVGLTGAVVNGVAYAGTSAAIQVLAGFSAFLFLRRPRVSGKLVARVLGHAMEAAFVLPYLMPSAGVYSALDWYLDPGGILEAFPLRVEAATGLLELHVLSAITLSPFAYLAFRLYEAVGRRDFFGRLTRPGHLQPQVFSVAISALALLLGQLFVFRFAVMLGKFDIPLLVGADPANRPALVNIPVYLDSLLRQHGGDPGPAMGTAGFLLLVALAVGFAGWVCISRLRSALAAAWGSLIARLCRVSDRSSGAREGPGLGWLIGFTLQVFGAIAVMVSIAIVLGPAGAALRSRSSEWAYLSSLVQPALWTWLFTMAPVVIGVPMAASLLYVVREYGGLVTRALRRGYVGFYAIPAALFFLAFWWCIRLLPPIPDRMLSSVLWYTGFLVLLGTPIAFVLASTVFPDGSTQERIFWRTVGRSQVWVASRLPVRRLLVAATVYLAVMTALVSSDLFAATRLLEGADTANMAFRQVLQASSGDHAVVLVGGVGIGIGNFLLCSLPWVAVAAGSLGKKHSRLARDA